MNYAIAALPLVAATTMSCGYFARAGLGPTVSSSRVLGVDASADLGKHIVSASLGGAAIGFHVDGAVMFDGSASIMAGAVVAMRLNPGFTRYPSARSDETRSGAGAWLGGATGVEGSTRGATELGVRGSLAAMQGATAPGALTGGSCSGSDKLQVCSSSMDYDVRDTGLELSWSGALDAAGNVTRWRLAADFVVEAATVSELSWH